jgi:AGZA family xanthine/uracil permease-like MFS transporter
LIEPDAATMVRLGAIDYRAALLLAGLVTAVVLMRRGNPLAFLASIFGVSFAAWALGYVKAPEQLVSVPDFSSVALKLDIAGALRPSLLPAIVSILFTDLFDSLSTFIGVATAAGLTEADGRPLNLRRGRSSMRSRPLSPAWPEHHLERRMSRASRASAWEAEAEWRRS